MNIKNLKPRKNSHYKQDIVNPKVFKKYVSSCKNEPVIYRSGLELQFIQYCENNSSIKRWASEPIAIRYFSRLDGKEQNYYPDFIIEKTSGKRFIVEIKPESQTYRPSKYDNTWSKEAWIKNSDKWIAAYNFAKKHNMEFIIVSEGMKTKRVDENLVRQFMNKQIINE